MALFSKKRYWTEIISTQSIPPGLRHFEVASTQLLEIIQAFQNKSTNIDHEATLISLNNSLQRASCAFHKLLNGSRPINRLPVEILEMIFTLVPKRFAAVGHRDDSLRGNHWPFSAPDSRDLRLLARVCHRWHELISRAPALWSTYRETTAGPVGFPVSSFMTRFSSAPIDIYANGSFSDDLEKLFREQGYRIRQVHSPTDDIEQRTANRLLSSLATLDSGSLEHCSIVVPKRSHPNSPLFTNRTAARIRSLLVISQSLVPVQEFHTLTRLVLSQNRIFRSQAWDVCSLLSLLAGAPKLEVLHLHSMDMRLSEGSRPSSRLIMSRLQQLHCQNILSDYLVPPFTVFLSSIQIPTHFHIRLHNIPFDTSSSSDLIALVRSIPSPIPPTHMGLYSRSGSFELDLKLELPCASDDGRAEGTSITFRAIGHRYYLDLDRFRDLIAAPALLWNLQELRLNITGDDSEDAQQTARMVSGLVNVRRLALSFTWSVLQRMPAFKTVFDPLTARPNKEPACPALEDLDVYVKESSDALMGIFSSILQSRAESDIPVRRFILYVANPPGHTLDPSPHVGRYAVERFSPMPWHTWPRARPATARTMTEMETPLSRLAGHG
ncbi:hypothetical protein C8Q80DRAFT_339318 [Daedaleopsis nitida]|nr:hypothetical protein C8Q80DRAFT_339318 [Daedaleopsis nitida]